MVKINNKAWQHELIVTSDQTRQLASAVREYTVLYFYPRANTPGCSTESQDFSEHYESFKALGCEIMGVSMDSLKKQQNFKNKFSMPFELVADIDEVLCQEFDVIKQKNMYGKQFLGIERSTFIINAEGQVLHAWRKVKVPGHVEEVLAAMKEISN